LLRNLKFGWRYRSENNFVEHQNNFVGTVKIMNNAAKNVQRTVF